MRNCLTVQWWFCYKMECCLTLQMYSWVYNGNLQHLQCIQNRIGNPMWEGSNPTTETKRRTDDPPTEINKSNYVTYSFLERKLKKKKGWKSLPCHAFWKFSKEWLMILLTVYTQVLQFSHLHLVLPIHYSWLGEVTQKTGKLRNLKDYSETLT